ncbi:MAG: aminoglycoside phosphotransferase family protein [Oscillospiraceae bacterium]|nr:aminoglycoside phosphotransferase family protein [Oscillospiraceae bacterium]
MDINTKLQEVCRGFCINGTYLGYETIQVGNVNKTYRVSVLTEEGIAKHFLVQNVNTYVFKNPIQVMENIDKVTEHIRTKQPDKVGLHFHHTADRKNYIVDGSNFWRMTNYIPSTTHSVVKDLEIVCNAGCAFGEFQMQLSDFDSSQLHETISGFHNTKQRYEKLSQTVFEDPCGKVSEVREELDYLFSVRDLACRLTDMQERGELPLRVTHNDTKINNVLFDKDTHVALVVIDLDTVMPGLVGHDFGDAIRFAANFTEEDCLEYERVGINMEVFRAFTEGFLRKTAHMLTKKEIDTLALSCFVLTVELAVRFLDDYIQGSPYFKINYPEHNLVRTRCQIALAKDMFINMEQMNACVHNCVTNAGLEE